MEKNLKYISLRILAIFLAVFICGSAHSQHFEWIDQVGLNGGGNDYTLDMAEDREGHVYTSGMMKNSSSVGSGPYQVTLAPFGDQDLLIAKYHDNGNLIWAKRYGSGLTEQGAAIEADTSGNIFVSGLFQTSFSMDGFNLTAYGVNNGYLAKLDSSGNVIWAVDWGNSGSSTVVHDIAIDEYGHTYVLGSFKATTIIGNDTLTSQGDSDIYLSKFDSLGNALWSKRYGNTLLDDGNTLKMLENGDLMAVGKCNGNVMFDTVQINGINLAWICKFDTSGQAIWGVHIGGDIGVRIGGMDADENNNVYVSANFLDTAYISADSSQVLITNGSSDLVVLKLDQYGQLLWQHTYGGAALDRAGDLAYHENGRLTFNFTILGNSEFNGEPLTLQGTDDEIYVELNQDGTHNWLMQITGYSQSGISAFTGRVHSASCNRTLICGAFLNTVYFPPFTKSAFISAADGFAGVLRPRVTSLDLTDSICVDDYGIYVFHDSCRIDSISFVFEGLDTTTYSGSNIQFSSSNSQVYSVKAIIDDGFYIDTLKMDSVITVFGLPNPFLIDSITICGNDSISLFPGTFDSYLWNDNSTDSSSFASAQGQYWVKVTDEKGCSDTAFTHLDHFQNTTINLGDDTTICSIDSILLDAGLFDEYLWSNGDTLQSIYVSDSGIVSLSIIDSNGCPASDDILIDVNDCTNIFERDFTSIQLFPNPVSDILYLRFKDHDQISKIEVLSVAGELVSISKSTNEIDMNNLSPGLYFVRLVFFDGQKYLQRVVKNN